MRDFEVKVGEKEGQKRKMTVFRTSPTPFPVIFSNFFRGKPDRIFFSKIYGFLRYVAICCANPREELKATGLIPRYVWRFRKSWTIRGQRGNLGGSLKKTGTHPLHQAQGVDSCIFRPTPDFPVGPKSCGKGWLTPAVHPELPEPSWPPPVRRVSGCKRGRRCRDSRAWRLRSAERWL